MPIDIKNKEHVKLTAITVNYNVANYVNKLIKSLHFIDNYIDEIIVIDNNSTDSISLVPSDKTKIIYNKSNLGFAKAVNQGIKISKTDFVLLINPDCYLTDNSMINSFKMISRKINIGAIGGKIKKHNSNDYHLTANSKATFLTGLFEFTNLKKIFPNNYYSKKFWIESNKISKPTKVESLCGAFIIIRKKLKNKLNLFDERYFLYMEDIDFGNKINSQSYDVIFDPSSQVTHLGGKSSGSKYKTVLNEWYRSRIKYFSKHLNIFQSLTLSIIFIIEEKLLLIFHKINKTPYV